MLNSKHKQLTEPERVFLAPAHPTHRQYEALRAYFVEGLPSQAVAKRFGSTPGSFRVLCHQFRHHPQRPFFILPQQGPHRAPKRDLVRDHVIALRQQNFSLYDISETLKTEGHTLSPVAVSLLFKAAGFARLPRRSDDERPDTPLQCIASWQQRTGQVPQARSFDSPRTTSSPLTQLNHSASECITSRRRSPKRRTAITPMPASAWRRVERHNVSRASRRPRVLDETIPRKDSDGPMRQVTVADRGHEEPTVLLTKQMPRAPATLSERYAQRMVMENRSADGIDCFPLDALSSAVAMPSTCDGPLTLLARSLSRLLGTQSGRGYETARGRHILRDFIDAVGLMTLTDEAVILRYQQRAHTPLLMAAGCANTPVPVPWLGGKRLPLVFG